MKNNEAKSRMRLIDAYDFIERMECDTDLCAEMERDGLKALKKYLDLQPTAYDLDKVIEHLKEEQEYSYADFTQYVRECCPYNDPEHDDSFYKGMERSILIVKGGIKTDGI